MTTTARPTIAVTGATGGLGGRVARRLADRGVAQRLIVRDAGRAPELDGAQVATIGGYADADGVQAALDGITTLFFVSGEEAADRLEQHRTALDAAGRAGVQRVVYTSFVGAAADATFTFAQDHFHTEEHLRARGLPFVALGNSMYTDYLPMMAADGTIRGPAGSGRFAPVTRDDIADVATELLLDDSHDGERLDVTGPELLTMAEVASVLSEVLGREIAYEDETVDEAYASRAGYDAPRFEVDGWVTSYLAIAEGELAVASDVVERVAGHPPESLASFVRRTGGAE